MIAALPSETLPIVTNPKPRDLVGTHLGLILDPRKLLSFSFRIFHGPVGATLALKTTEIRCNLMCATGHYLSRFLELTYAQGFGFGFLHIGGNKGPHQGQGEPHVALLQNEQHPTWQAVVAMATARSSGVRVK